jgi:CRISPR/Cas system endoribonuclease Cas6 (RAMP superfamily)
MPISLLFSLVSQNSSKLRRFYGRELQAWFLSQVARHARSLADSIHSTEGLCSYTISGLLEPSIIRGIADNPKNEYWLRITALSDSLGTVLLEKIAPDAPPTLNLQTEEFKITGWTTEGNWAGQTTYNDIMRHALSSTSSSKIKLSFTSPTAFRYHNKMALLPSPNLVWMQKTEQGAQ